MQRKTRFHVIEVGWGRDFDDNRHPRLRIGRATYSIVLYDHPANGWKFVTLKIQKRGKNDSSPQELHGESAESELAKQVRGRLVLTHSELDAIADDLYAIGRRGAAKRWIGKTLSLHVERSVSVSH